MTQLLKPWGRGHPEEWYRHSSTFGGYVTRWKFRPFQCQRTVIGTDGPLAWESSGP